MRVLSWDFARSTIFLVRAWMVSCMIFGVEVGEQKVVIRLVRVGLSGSSMMGAEMAMLSRRLSIESYGFNGYFEE